MADLLRAGRLGPPIERLADLHIPTDLSCAFSGAIQPGGSANAMGHPGGLGCLHVQTPLWLLSIPLAKVQWPGCCSSFDSGSGFRRSYGRDDRMSVG
jgi:hypothetical protein